MPSLRRVMEPTWTYDSLTTLTGGHTPPQLGQRGGWNGVRHGHRGIITHHKWPQVFRVTAVLDKSVHEYKLGTLKSGKGGTGGKVKSRKQAVAIGLSEVRKAGAKIPHKGEKSS